ncbi:hypothetical protein M378DRAFT_169912 [Amanita muscaria Koide BX008]|uniref:Uncharacterized protein n=1 Tax=Amanita muscaria (strain Koide BX008) TaxID=946122 RepID=A0A0C2WRX1_AMAMK|nr:hypothetical protein M378DRAFT_169912 [Amanita muscaria Koide BX008]
MVLRWVSDQNEHSRQEKTRMIRIPVIRYCLHPEHGSQSRICRVNKETSNELLLSLRMW